MGTHDTIMVPCPRCESIVNVQTITGDRCGVKYGLEESPAHAIIGLDNEAVQCRCGCRFWIRINVLILRTTTTDWNCRPNRIWTNSENHCSRCSNRFGKETLFQTDDGELLCRDCLAVKVQVMSLRGNRE